MGHWYLVRHGETDWNLTERIQGQVDVPLNATGRRQVSHLAKRLTDLPLDAIYSSDLARTHETARIIAADRDIAIATDPDLREFSFGEWEGLTAEEIEARRQARCPSGSAPATRHLPRPAARTPGRCWSGCGASARTPPSAMIRRMTSWSSPTVDRFAR